MARSSSYLTGGPDPDRKTNWEPRVDRDPFYRTMDIFNGVFHKRVKLSAGKTNSTDLHTIYINFGELKPSKIAQALRSGSDANHTVFLLECGHEWEGKNLKEDGQPKVVGEDYGMCGICGAQTSYRGFEHEWQHIIFKSDLAAMVLFRDQYADQLLKQVPAGSIDRTELSNFLHMLINAFDDIRVNSLWEKVYPGSAVAIWERWRYFATRMKEVNTSFLAFIFAVAFDVPTNPQGEFEPMRPVIEWALEQVKYRGFNNMLLDVRVVMDRCMGALLSKMKPPPSKLQPPPPPSLGMPPPQSSPGGGEQEDGEGEPQIGDGNESEEDKDQSGQAGEEAEQGNSSTSSGSTPSSSPNRAGNQPGAASPKIGSGQEGQSDQESQQVGPGAGQNPLPQHSPKNLGGVPSATEVQAGDQERAGALSRLMQDPKVLDPKEEHSAPTDEDLQAAQKSEALRAALNAILHRDLSKVDDLDVSGKPDADMQAQISQLQNNVVKKNDSSQLTDGSKAKVTIIKVTSEGTGSDRIRLEADELAIIRRLRAAFFRSMGRQKAKRASVGNSVDVESLIQYLGDRQDSEVFIDEDVNQGFAYSVVCDMSGSMSGSFPAICRAVEMLKQALHFPFVVGNLWGFRGGQPMIHTKASHHFGNGEVWMYQYDRDVNWYTGTTPFRLFPGPNGLCQVPVECGGITPMNSAINVATSHLWRKMPAGMAKRMFLLTDGSPIQTKVTGRSIPEHILRQFVAKEIARARSHGIFVHTTVVGEHAIDEDKCLQMFGPRKYWVRVGRSRIGTSLLALVLRNFNGYLRRR